MINCKIGYSIGMCSTVKLKKRSLEMEPLFFVQVISNFELFLFASVNSYNCVKWTKTNYTG